MRSLSTTRRLPRAIEVYVGGVVVLGGVVALLAVATTPHGPTNWVVLLALVCGAAQLLRVALPRASSVSPTVAVSFMALVWLGLGGAAIVGLAGTAAHALFRRQAPVKAVFNAAVLVLAAAAAATVYQVLGGPSSNGYLADTLTAVIAALAYFGANTGLIAGAISLDAGPSLWTVWSDNYLEVAPSFVLMAMIGAGAGAAVETGGPTAFASSTGLVLLSWTSVALYASRARQARRALAALAERANRPMLDAGHAPGQGCGPAFTRDDPHF